MIYCLNVKCEYCHDDLCAIDAGESGTEDKRVVINQKGECRIMDFGDKEANVIKIGDKVVMNSNYVVSEKYEGVEFAVRSEPFNICGSICVMLEGYSGGYSLDGLTKVN